MANSHVQINSQIKVIKECFVKPKYDVEAAKQPYLLGLVDIACLPLHQIQKGLLFPVKPKNIQSALLEKLKNALSISLVHFYPLAGQLATEIYPDEHLKWVYVDCDKGPGARLIHATVDLTVSDIKSSVDVHPIVKYLFDFGEEACNNDGHTRPLLSIQVTELIDGVVIGFTMNHSVVDGTSQWHFINALSEIFLQLDNHDSHLVSVGSNLNNDRENCENGVISISNKPIFKPCFPDGYGPILKLPYNESDKFMDFKYQGVLRERIFHFSSASMANLKAKANEECGVQNISSFQALSAFVWRSITRARNLETDAETACAFAMNARPRFSPPLSNDYFGNFIARNQALCKAGDVLSKGFGWAAKQVHEAVISQDDKAVRDFYDRIIKFLLEPKGPPFYTPNIVMIGGSARFNMYGAEFGFGKAVAIVAGYANKEDGKVTASPGREGGGSVDLEICLKPETMKALEVNQEFMSFVTLESN